MELARREPRAVEAGEQGPRPGDRIAGRFVLERLAGRGSAGVVFRGLDLETEQPVALKLFHRSRSGHSDRSLQEARALARVDHPAVVRLVAHGRRRDGAPYIAMTWVEGETLDARLAREGLSPLDSLRLARRLSDALAALHLRGIVHRDVKPSNIVLEGGQVERACLVDLGVSHDYRAPVSSESDGTYVGTPRYMAPEQIHAPDRAQPHSDVFSLGCILFECLTGVPAFGETEICAILAQILFEPSPRLRSRRAELPPELDGLLAGLLARRPELRPLPGRVLHLQLTAAMSGLTGLALSRLGPPLRRDPTSGTAVTASSGIFAR